MADRDELSEEDEDFTAEIAAAQQRRDAGIGVCATGSVEEVEAVRRSVKDSGPECLVRERVHRSVVKSVGSKGVKVVSPAGESLNSSARKGSREKSSNRAYFRTS